MSIVYHCLTCNAPLTTNRFHICSACRQIEAIEKASAASNRQPEVQWTRDPSAYSGGCSMEEAEKAENEVMLVLFAVYLIIDYNLNWFFAKFAWICCKLLYIMFFSWWI